MDEVVKQSSYIIIIIRNLFRIGIINYCKYSVCFLDRKSVV